MAEIINISYLWFDNLLQMFPFYFIVKNYSILLQKQLNYINVANIIYKGQYY